MSKPTNLDRQGPPPPLRAEAAPRGPVPFAAWQRARDRACAALLAGETRLLLTGPAGTGKSMLVHDIARILGVAGWSVLVRLPASASGIIPEESGGRVLLVVDEADRLSAPDLEHLLRNWPSPLLLAGLDTLSSHCPGLTRIALAPLDEEQSRVFISHYLAQAGEPPNRLEEAAVCRVLELSRGLPRLLASLVGAGLWMANVAGAAQVSRERVEDAASLRACLADDAGPAVPAPAAAAPDLPLQPVRRPGRRTARLAACPACVVALAVPAGIFWPALPTEPAPTAVATLAETAPSLSPVQAELPPTTPPPAQAVSLEPAPPPQSAVVEPPPEPPPLQTAAIGAAPILTPEPVEPAPVQPLPRPALARLPAPKAAAPEREVLSPAIIETLLRRGNEMVALGDLSAARLLFGRASAAGDHRAMLAMGRTFDPAVIAEIAPGMTPEPTTAAQWYRLAAESGSPEAAALLQRVERLVAR